MKKFKTNVGEDRIDEVEVVRESEQSVWVRGYRGVERRESKMSQCGCYFDTWEEAHAYLVDKQDFKVVLARSSLAYAEKQLAEVQALKKPESKS